jgi:two-component system, NtrC family, response regulator AtoC
VSGEPTYQLVIVSGEQIRTFPLPHAGEVMIGRDEAAALRIDDPSVSRRHAVLRVGAGLEIEDLGGANGTFLRQKPRRDPDSGNETLHITVRQLLSRKASLAIGDGLLFGTTSVVVRRVPRVTLPDLASAESPSASGASDVVVRDPSLQAVYVAAAKVARSKISVLLLGETGVGKEVLARAIHAHSQRAKGPFIGVNCAALADSLIESELFGSEKGAFTGALGRAGLFEAANGGTLFLDEVGELPLGTQAKLLRVLEERAVVRLGSTHTRPIDVRFMAATHRDPAADSRQGRLRADLYFRLNGVSLLIPPLRDRPRELEALATSFLEAACRDLEQAPSFTLSAAALESLRRYGWPGNVRELRNVIERAVVMCSEGTILPEHLPPALLEELASVRSEAAAPAEGGGRLPDLSSEMRSLERSRILEALERCRGNQSEAARLLGMPRRTLVSRLTQFGLTRRRGEAR